MYKYCDSNLRPTIWVQCWKLRQWRSISKTPWDFVEVLGDKTNPSSSKCRCLVGNTIRIMPPKSMACTAISTTNQNKKNNMMFSTKERQLTREQSKNTFGVPACHFAELFRGRSICDLWCVRGPDDWFPPRKKSSWQGFLLLGFMVLKPSQIRTSRGTSS